MGAQSKFARKVSEIEEGPSWKPDPKDFENGWNDETWAKVEKLWGLCGGLKVIPSQRYIPECVSESECMAFKIPPGLPLEQRVVRVWDGVYGLSKVRGEQEYKTFQDLKDDPTNPENSVLEDALKNANWQEDYWKDLKARTDKESEVYLATYANDVEGNGLKYTTTGLGLYGLPSVLKSLADYDVLYPGISLGMLYAGLHWSTFGPHGEDYLLHSASYLLFGGLKIWYLCHPDDYELVLTIIKEKFPTTEYPDHDCTDRAYHKDFLLDPTILLKRGVRIKMFIQRPGELLLVKSRSIHFGYNLGFTVAQALNFSDKETLITALLSTTCPSVRTDFNEIPLDLAARQYYPESYDKFVNGEWYVKRPYKVKGKRADELVLVPRPTNFFSINEEVIQPSGVTYIAAGLTLRNALEKDGQVFAPGQYAYAHINDYRGWYRRQDLEGRYWKATDIQVKFYDEYFDNNKCGEIVNLQVKNIGDEAIKRAVKNLPPPEQKKFRDEAEKNFTAVLPKDRQANNFTTAMHVPQNSPAPDLNIIYAQSDLEGTLELEDSDVMDSDDLNESDLEEYEEYESSEGYEDEFEEEGVPEFANETQGQLDSGDMDADDEEENENEQQSEQEENSARQPSIVCNLETGAVFYGETQQRAVLSSNVETITTPAPQTQHQQRKRKCPAPGWIKPPGFVHTGHDFCPGCKAPKTQFKHARTFLHHTAKLDTILPCSYCGNQYSERFVLTRHMKSCALKPKSNE